MELGTSCILWEFALLSEKTLHSFELLFQEQQILLPSGGKFEQYVIQRLSLLISAGAYVSVSEVAEDVQPALRLYSGHAYVLSSTCAHVVSIPASKTLRNTVRTTRDKAFTGHIENKGGSEIKPLPLSSDHMSGFAQQAHAQHPCCLGGPIVYTVNTVVPGTQLYPSKSTELTEPPSTETVHIVCTSTKTCVRYIRYVNV